MPIQPIHRLNIRTANQMPVQIYGDLYGTMLHLLFHIRGAFLLLEDKTGKGVA